MLLNYMRALLLYTYVANLYCNDHSIIDVSTTQDALNIKVGDLLSFTIPIQNFVECDNFDVCFLHKSEEIVDSLFYYKEDYVIWRQSVLLGFINKKPAKPIIPDATDVHHGEGIPPLFPYPILPIKLINLRYLTWRGTFTVGIWGDGKDVPGILWGLAGGPLVLFKEPNNLAVLIAPLDNFFHSIIYPDCKLNADSCFLSFGVSSELEELPPGFLHETVMIVSKQGISDVIHKYSEMVRNRATPTNRIIKDIGISLYTDNGGYYYGDAWNYTCCSGSDLQRAFNTDIQWTQLQLDDWWYPGEKSIYVKCIESWEARTDLFPSGLKGLHESVGVPLALYIPFFCKNYNAKNIRFLNGTKFAIAHPDDSEQFFTALFSEKSDIMNLIEHDFLNFNFLAVREFRSKFGWARKWFQGFARAAEKFNIDLMLCMQLPSHILETALWEVFSQELPMIIYMMEIGILALLLCF